MDHQIEIVAHCIPVLGATQPKGNRAICNGVVEPLGTFTSLQRLMNW